MKNPYANIPSAMWLLATVSLISRSGSMVLIFLPLYLTQKLGFDIIIAGQIVSLYGLGEIAGSYPGGIMTDKFGSLKVQTYGLLFVGMLYIILELLSSKFAIMPCMFFIGLFTASIRPATGESIARLATPETRTRAYALNYQAVNLGASIGPIIGGIVAGISYMWVFRIDGIANILAAVALSIFFSKYSFNNSLEKEPLQHGSATTSVWQDKPFLIFLLLACIIGMCFFQLLNIYPLFLSNNFHLSTREIGMVMAFNGALIILFQMQLTSFFKKFNTIRVISSGGILICVGYFILPWYSGFYYALFSMSVISLGEMLLMPFAFDMIAKISPSERRGLYLGLLTCALSSIPLFVTPNLMPYIYSTFGPNVLWSSMGIVGVIIFIGFESLNTTYFGSGNVRNELQKIENNG